ncbi:MAG: hypothetical protein HYS13_10130 [Planctomycetia bacterium]|nr:hypothetical protein [Planctomycetia bacterium]
MRRLDRLSRPVDDRSPIRLDAAIRIAVLKAVRQKKHDPCAFWMVGEIAQRLLGCAYDSLPWKFPHVQLFERLVSFFKRVGADARIHAEEQAKEDQSQTVRFHLTRSDATRVVVEAPHVELRELTLSSR